VGSGAVTTPERNSVIVTGKDRKRLLKPRPDYGRGKGKKTKQWELIK